MRALVPASLLTLLLLLAWPAAAQDVSSASGEIAGLEDALTRDEQALSGGECSIACPALGSMARSVKRLCELDPGERCAKARARVAAASERVRAQCPDCQAVTKKQADEFAAPDTPAATGTQAGGTEAVPAAAPPSEDVTRGGCAGCRVGDARPRAPGLLAALALLLALGVRRRGARRDR